MGKDEIRGMHIRLKSIEGRIYPVGPRIGHDSKRLSSTDEKLREYTLSHSLSISYDPLSLSLSLSLFLSSLSPLIFSLFLFLSPLSFCLCLSPLCVWSFLYIGRTRFLNVHCSITAVVGRLFWKKEPGRERERVHATLRKDGAEVRQVSTRKTTVPSLLPNPNPFCSGLSMDFIHLHPSQLSHLSLEL